ncbi:hypothetical protein HDV00_011834 [Rhizophlyctis rosea]|nr:hypothetical protein HDV00_011834 [Rhizophlyctis rosea]
MSLPPSLPEDEVVRAQKLYLFRQELGDTYKVRYGYWDSIQSGNITTHHRSLTQFPSALRPPTRELIRWLYQLVEFFGYATTECFQLAVNYLDRVCSKYVTRLCEYQALGAACFLIAAKASEPHPPTCSDLARLSAGAFDVTNLMDTELTILQVLRWNLNAPTPTLFLDAFIRLFPMKKKDLDELMRRADIFVAVIQSDHRFMKYRPSVQVAAALRCAFTAMGKPVDLFQAYLTRELDILSLDTATIVAGLELPQMREINECAKIMSRVINSALDHMQEKKAKAATTSSSSVASRTRSNTTVRHGLPSPVSESPNENLPPLECSSDPSSEDTVDSALLTPSDGFEGGVFSDDY